MPDSHSTDIMTKRSKSPKKKPRTITAIATAQYEPVKADSMAQDPASKFFEARSASSRDVDPNCGRQTSMAAQEKTKANRCRKSPSKVSKEKAEKQKNPKTTKKPKRVSAGKKLHSPEAALKRAERQDLMFGTSSQLASEESPTTMRQLQQAIRESEATAPVLETHHDAIIDLSHMRRSSSLIKASRQLWSVAARDHDDGTLAAEPKASEYNSLGTTADNGTSFVHIDAVLSESPAAPRADTNTQNSGKVAPSEAYAEKASSHDQGHGKAVASDNTVADKAENSSDGQRDVLQPVTDNARLKSEQGPQYLISKEDPSESVRDYISSKPAKKPRGRPRKDPCQPPKPRKPRKPPASDAKSTPTKRRRKPVASKKTSQLADESEWHQIDDISDCEPSPTPSPPRRRASQPPPPAQPLELTSTAPKQAPFTSTSKRSNTGPINETEQHLWPSLSARLFPLLTAIVKTEPPTTDPKKPSWHEKILMYDPIIAEDFTDWLKDRINVEGLEKNGLKPWMVQKWCEENSICCVMKNNGWH